MTECICPVCGKNFIPAPYHIYNDFGKFYCSWTCYNRRDARYEKRKIMKVIMKRKNGEVLKVFESAKEAAELMGFLPNGIREACREKTQYMGYFWEYKN